MQKKIGALTIVAAMAIPAVAMAEVTVGPTVYGQVNMAYESVNDGGDGNGAGTSSTTRSRVSSNVSRLGFKGSEDLGNGLTAVYQMESTVNIDTGTVGKPASSTSRSVNTACTVNTTTCTTGVATTTTTTTTAAQLFDRNTYLGLAGGFGTVVLGNHDTPYKMATRGLDVFADSIADNRSIMGQAGVGHDTRLTDVLAYVSPNWGGFSAALALVNKTDNTLGAASPSEASAMSLFAKYGMEMWSVALANQTVTIDSPVAANTDKYTATKLAGSFAMSSFSVGLVYEMLKDEVGNAPARDRNNIYVSGAYNVTSSGKIKLAVTMAGESDNGGAANQDGATQMALGYDHALSKATTLFALYTSVSNDDRASYGLTSGGSSGDTAAGGTTSATTLAGSPSAIAIGVRHSF